MNTASESTPIVPENPAIPSVLRVSSGHKRNGKIAQLPKAVRDKINQWIDDGRTYPQIIKDLGDDAKDLKPNHFSEWRKGGYQDYLRHQEWRDQLRILRENGSDMSELTDGPKFQETLVQIALTEIFRVLEQRELKPDSLNYIRLFNALARLNREALGLRKYNDHLAKEQAELKQLDINRDISRNEHRAIVDRTDRIFRMPRPAPDETSSEPCRRRREETQTNDQPAISDSRNTEHVPVLRSAFGEGGSRTIDPASTPSPIENQKSKIKNPSSPLPSRPCHAETPESPRMVSLSASGGEGQGEVASKSTRGKSSPTKNRKPKIENPSPIPPNNPQIHQSINPPSEHCLECHATLLPVPPHSLRRPDDHCPSCGMRLPDIGLCAQPGFDKCLNCGATQPALLPGGERPRPHCHKCGERLHNPESSM